MQQIIETFEQNVSELEAKNNDMITNKLSNVRHVAFQDVLGIDKDKKFVLISNIYKRYLLLLRCDQLFFICSLSNFLLFHPILFHLKKITKYLNIQ